MELKLQRQHFSAKIYRSYLTYIKTNYPHINLNDLCKAADLNLEYLENEDNWVSVVFGNNFSKIILEQTKDKDIFYEVGKTGILAENLGSLLHSIIKHILSTSKLYKTITTQTKNFSKILEMAVLKNKKNLIALL